MPKAESSYTPAPAMVHLCKPAHRGDTAITDKTGGCNSKADVGERTYIDWPAREPGCQKSNGWCRLPSKTNQSAGMRKGSVVVRGFAAKGFNAVSMVGGAAVRRDIDREVLLSSRQAKGTWCVVFGGPKDH